MNDGDPQTKSVLTDMRATWDNAPTVAALDGHAVTLSGYVVPLEASRGALKEFLLVPYFGACVHTPPPPANQIVHVTADILQVDLRSMSTARISGTLRTARQDSGIGVSGYSLAATRVERMP